MRNCENCEYSGFILDCNTGKETLNCFESEYVCETELNKVCELHQFVDGLETEKNYLLFDVDYLGPGYFIVHETDGVIDKFVKIYIDNNNGFPNYSLRAYDSNFNENLDNEFNNIEFKIGCFEDFEMFDYFKEFYKKLDGNSLYSIDSIQHGKNNISLNMNSRIISFNISKDMINGKQHPSKFIDINLGDICTCKNYGAVNDFYNSLVSICKNKTNEEDINKILVLKW